MVAMPVSRVLGSRVSASGRGRPPGRNVPRPGWSSPYSRSGRPTVSTPSSRVRSAGGARDPAASGGGGRPRGGPALPADPVRPGPAEVEVVPVAVAGRQHQLGTADLGQADRAVRAGQGGRPPQSRVVLAPRPGAAGP